MKKETLKTTVSLDVATAKKIAKYATQQQKSRNDVISVMADYFMKNGIDPFEVEPPTQAINRLAKRNEDLIKLFRGIERDSIRPLMIEAEKLVVDFKKIPNAMKQIAIFIKEQIRYNTQTIVEQIQKLETQNNSMKNAICRLYDAKAVEKGKFNSDDFNQLFSDVY